MVVEVLGECPECGRTGVYQILWRLFRFSCPSCGCVSLGTVRKIKRRMDYDERTDT
ncbi:MAG: hypothetical protein IKU32_02160 [Clostridia bacterium]|nr:hypothetical protein [Clostridia bacterium]